MPEDYMAMYKQALERLSTGGMALEASLQEIEEGKRQAIAGGQAGAIRGGLGGTTVMGAVPLAAEKTAARQRLGARGRAEETYLTTLASFAAFAQRGEEATKQREFEAQLAQYGARQTSASVLQQAQLRHEETQRQQQFMAEQAGEQRKFETEQTRQAEWAAHEEQSYARRFPSLYDQGEAAVPDWTGGVTGDVTGGGYATPWGQETPIEELMAGTTFEFAGQPTTGAIPTQQQVGMTGAMGSLPGQAPQPTQGGPAGHEQIRVRNRQGKIEMAWHVPGTPIQLAPGYTLA